MFKIIFLLLFSIALLANPYHIEDLSEIIKMDKTILLKLKKNNIKTTDDFLLINKSSKERAINSKKYNLDIKNLGEIISLFDLLRIKGVGPTAAKLLIKADVKSIRVFKTIDLKKLEKKLIDANKKFKISPYTPNKQNLEVWRNFAKKLKVIIL